MPSAKREDDMTLEGETRNESGVDGQIPGVAILGVYQTFFIQVAIYRAIDGVSLSSNSRAAINSASS